MSASLGVPANLLAGLKLPVIAAPMFIVSGVELVVATCKAGMIGTLPALNARPTSQLDDWLCQVEDRLAGQDAARYGVNLILHKSNQRLEQDLEVIVRHQVPLVITSGGHNPELIKAVQAYGGAVFHDVIHMKHAMQAASAGVDGIIAVCAGAGGHAGLLNPFTFVRQLREHFGGAVVLAGALGDGQQVCAARALGADFAYMGTRFIATQEANADPRYKQMILDASSSDVIYTDRISGIHANFMRQSLEANGIDIVGGAIPELDLEHEATAWKDVWSAGHAVGQIRDVPTVADLGQRMLDEYHTSLTLLEQVNRHA